MIHHFSTTTLVDVQILKLNRFDPSPIYTSIAFVTSVPIYFCSLQLLFMSIPFQSYLSVFFWLFENLCLPPSPNQYSFATFININTLKIICISFFITNVFFFSFFSFFVSISMQMHHPIQMKPADSENRNGKFLILYFVCVFFFFFFRIQYFNLHPNFNHFSTIFPVLIIYFVFCALHLVRWWWLCWWCCCSYRNHGVCCIVAYSFRSQLIKVPHLMKKKKKNKLRNISIQCAIRKSVIAYFSIVFRILFRILLHQSDTIDMLKNWKSTLYVFYFAVLFLVTMVLDQKIKCLFAICRTFLSYFFFRKYPFSHSFFFLFMFRFTYYIHSMGVPVKETCRMSITFFGFSLFKFLFCWLSTLLFSWMQTESKQPKIS